MPDAAPILQATITCPVCGTARTETMPTDACRFFYDCTGCGALLRPKPGDCCVFCSYGDVPCPPVQAARRAAAPAPGRPAAGEGITADAGDPPSAAPEGRCGPRAPGSGRRPD
ncbi:GDCCVxC domain-containing (seleno)protein [Caldovatus aquaticus]